MEQLLTFIANHPILVGAFAVVLAALIATESARLTRKWKELDTAQAILLMNRRDPLILDVSNSSDHAKAHIMNAEHIAPSRIESGNAELLKQKSRPVLVYDKSGQVSPQMARRLVQMGFEDVNVLRGGLAQWTSDQQPVTRAKAGKGAKGGRKERKGKNRKRRQRREELAAAAGPGPDANERPADDRADQDAGEEPAASGGAKNDGAKDSN